MQLLLQRQHVLMVHCGHDVLRVERDHVQALGVEGQPHEREVHFAEIEARSQFVRTFPDDREVHIRMPLLEDAGPFAHRHPERESDGEGSRCHVSRVARDTLSS